jgi:hypothetical protein
MASNVKFRSLRSGEPATDDWKWRAMKSIGSAIQVSCIDRRNIGTKRGKSTPKPGHLLRLSSGESATSTTAETRIAFVDFIRRMNPLHEQRYSAIRMVSKI